MMRLFALARIFAGRCFGATSALLLVLMASGTGLADAADIKAVDLGKNAQVWFTEDHTVPIVSFNISLPAGAAYDPAGKAGLASFAASLIDEGAGGLDSAAFHQALADRAIQFSASAQRDYLVVSISTLSENAPEAMRLLQFALSRPRFDAEAVARVRAQIVQSLEQAEVEPPSVAAKGFMHLFFNGHPYGQPSGGEIASIAAIKTDDLRAFVRSHWVRRGLKIAVAGDITAPVLQKLLGQTFAPLPDTMPQALPDVGRLGAPGLHVLPMPVPQPTAVFGLPGIMRSDPDFIPGYVANYILGGGGFSSRLMTEVRVKRGLTYGISTSLDSYRKASIMAGEVATRADAIDQTMQVVKDTMADFAANGATQQELDDAKTFLTGSFPIAFASNGGTAAQLGSFQRQGLDIGYVARRNALIQAVTLDDVRRAAKRLFDPARLTVVVAGSPQGGRASPGPKPPVRPAPARPSPLLQPPVVAPNPAAQQPAPTARVGAPVPGSVKPVKPADPTSVVKPPAKP